MTVPEDPAADQDVPPAGPVWTPPTFEVHGVRPTSGKQPRWNREGSNKYAAYYPSKSPGKSIS
jgi:hypothetical protein